MFVPSLPITTKVESDMARHLMDAALGTILTKLDAGLNQQVIKTHG